MNNKEWLEKLKPIIDIQIENDSHYGRPAQVTLYSTDINRLVERAERAESLEYQLDLERKRSTNIGQQNKQYYEAIESIKSEINYSLHSHKSKDVKRFYLENAIRYANEVLESKTDE